MILVDSVLEAMLGALIATDGPLDPAATWVAVATAVNDQGGATTMGDVTAPPGTVATRVPVTTWTGPYRMNDGRWVADAPIATFTPANATQGCIVTHFLLADALVAGGLIAFGLLPVPLTLVNEDNHARVVVRVTLDPTGRWDATIAWNG